MPAQLLQRLRRFLDQTIAQGIMGLENLARNDNPLPWPAPQGPNPPPPQTEDNTPARNTRAHWPRQPFGDQMTNVQSIMIHETSGWPSFYSANNFDVLFRCLGEYSWKRPTETRPGFWTDRRGIGPQYFVDPNGTAFTLIGQQDFTGDPRLTWHGENMNNISLGIENANAGNSQYVMGLNNLPPNNQNRDLWRDMTNRPEDLTGRLCCK